MIVKQDTQTRVKDPTGDLIEQCQLMLRFASKEGLQTDADLRRDIARLDRILIKAKLPPISDVAPELIAAESPPPSPEPKSPGEPIGAGLTMPDISPSPTPA